MAVFIGGIDTMHFSHCQVHFALYIKNDAWCLSKSIVYSTQEAVYFLNPQSSKLEVFSSSSFDACFHLFMYFFISFSRHKICPPQGGANSIIRRSALNPMNVFKKGIWRAAEVPLMQVMRLH